MSSTRKPNDVLKKVHDLIKLSQSDNEDEARTAAMQATRLMAQHQLVLVPQSELDRVNEAVRDMQRKMDEAKDDGTKRMLIGAVLGFAAAGKGLL